jgi:hypothetical protein
MRRRPARARRSVDRGTHRPTTEPRKSAPGCRRRRDSGRQYGGWRDREPPADPARSETLACADAPCAGTGRSRARPQASAVWSASGRHGAVADDARSREVGQVRSPKEVPEQGRATGSGGDGGKAPGRGETSRQSTDRTQSRVSCPTRRLVRLCRCMGRPNPIGTTADPRQEPGAESCTPGSVRGVRVNAHPYRDKGAHLEARNNADAALARAPRRISSYAPFARVTEMARGRRLFDLCH